MLTREHLIEKLKSPEVRTYFQSHGFSRVSLFGSYAREDYTSESDVDLFVEHGDRGFTIFDLFHSETEIAEKLGVKEVQITVKPKHATTRYDRFQKHIASDLIPILE